FARYRSAHYPGGSGAHRHPHPGWGIDPDPGGSECRPRCRGGGGDHIQPGCLGNGNPIAFCNGCFGDHIRDLPSNEENRMPWELSVRRGVRAPGGTKNHLRVVLFLRLLVKAASGFRWSIDCRLTGCIRIDGSVERRSFSCPSLQSPRPLELFLGLPELPPGKPDKAGKGTCGKQKLGMSSQVVKQGSQQRTCGHPEVSGEIVAPHGRRPVLTEDGG